MKVLILNGSPRINGNTSVALNEMVKIFEAGGIQTEVVQIGNKAVRGCIACGSCYEKGKCVFNDIVNELEHQIKPLEKQAETAAFLFS